MGRCVPHRSPMDLDCVIGVRGPISPPEMCNGLLVPIVVFDQIYSFDRDTLVKAIPRPEKTPAKDFAPAAQELFDRIMLMTDNAGATDEHRALNYLALRYQAIYANAAEAFARNEALTAVVKASCRHSFVARIVILRAQACKAGYAVSRARLRLAPARAESQPHCAL